MQQPGAPSQMGQMAQQPAGRCGRGPLDTTGVTIFATQRQPDGGTGFIPLKCLQLHYAVECHVANAFVVSILFINSECYNLCNWYNQKLFFNMYSKHKCSVFTLILVFNVKADRIPGHKQPMGDATIICSLRVPPYCAHAQQRNGTFINLYALFQPLNCRSILPTNF